MLLRLHRRAKYIGRIFNQLRQLRRRSGLRAVHVTAMVDRPSAAVLAEVNHATRNLPEAITWSIHRATETPLSAAGERWMEHIRHHHEVHLAEFDPQAILVLDDDQLFTTEGLRELRGHLMELRADRYDFRSIFMWDDPARYNATMLGHWSSILYRVYPGDAYATHFVNHSPEACARSKVVVRMVWPLRNYGYLTEEDRAEAWERSREAGRIDAFTLNFKKKNAKTTEWNPETWIQRSLATSPA